MRWTPTEDADADGHGHGRGRSAGFTRVSAYKHEKEELQMAQPSWVLEDAELQLCGAAVRRGCRTRSVGAP